jgi:hypothetical protein
MASQYGRLIAEGLVQQMADELVGIPQAIVAGDSSCQTVVCDEIDRAVTGINALRKMLIPRDASFVGEPIFIPGISSACSIRITETEGPSAEATRRPETPPPATTTSAVSIDNS